MDDSHDVKKFILEHLEKHPKDIATFCANELNITRTTVHRHLNKLIQQGRIIKQGSTKSSIYYLSDALNRNNSYAVSRHLSEDTVFTNDFEPVFVQFPENIYDICNYGFTEMFNNAIEHSQATKINAATKYADDNLIITIADNGIGIFKNIYDYFKLDAIEESILQLNKGKMTTDPMHHTGKGIFFTARAFDTFEIYANSLHYLRDNNEKDWSFETLPNNQAGSTIVMSINVQSNKNLVTLFKQFQESNELAFDRTEITVALARFGQEKFISRSQAKRILRGLAQFKHVTLDFAKVKLVGQGFVDEIFRVYGLAHPDMTIDYINANKDVLFMIKRTSSVNTQDVKK